jgi:hypothetical protein
MGASPQHIVRFLQAVIDEIKSGRRREPAGPVCLSATLILLPLSAE